MADQLTEWRQQIETKRSEANAILAKGVKSQADMDRAEKLVDEIDSICKLIDQHQESAFSGRAYQVKAMMAKQDAFLNQPVRRLPFETKAVARYEPSRPSAEARGETLSQVDKMAGTGGFKSLGHFSYAVFSKGRDGNNSGSAVDLLRKWEEVQPQLAVKESRELEALGYKAGLGMMEGSDPDGGNLVPSDFSNQIYTRSLQQNQILNYLNVWPVVGETLTMPALKEDSRADGYRQGGIQSYWTGEAEQYTKSKPSFRMVADKLKKLTVLCYATEELLADSPTALDRWLGTAVPKEINFKVNDSVISGNGAGVPLGIMNSGSKITVAAVSGQGANTIVAKNILAMWKRIPASQRDSVVWLYNQDVEDQLYSLFQPTGSTSGVLFFTPNTERGGFTLMGRPAIPVEQCETLGTEGDLICFATDGYFAITKGGIQYDMSIHLRFDYDERCFKWRFRFDGQPFDNVPLSPYKGSTTYSSIATLSSSRT